MLDTQCEVTYLVSFTLFARWLLSEFEQSLKPLEGHRRRRRLHFTPLPLLLALYPGSAISSLYMLHIPLNICTFVLPFTK